MNQKALMGLINRKTDTIKLMIKSVDESNNKEYIEYKKRDIQNQLNKLADEIHHYFEGKN